MWFQIRVAALRLSPKEHPVYCIVWSCSKTQLSLPTIGFPTWAFGSGPGTWLRGCWFSCCGCWKFRVTEKSAGSNRFCHIAMAEPDYYQLIGVDRNATLHEIRWGWVKTYEEAQTIPIFWGWRSVDYQLHRSLFKNRLPIICFSRILQVQIPSQSLGRASGQGRRPQEVPNAQQSLQRLDRYREKTSIWHHWASREVRWGGVCGGLCGWQTPLWA